MMKPLAMKILLCAVLICSACYLQAQPATEPKPGNTVAAKTKPYKVLTNGRQITIQSKQNIKSIMVWTAGGHRFVEEKSINLTNYSFSVPPKEKLCFIMIETADTKRFTEKIGVQ